jgi:uncharacterized delta-60 repeat protein
MHLLEPIGAWESWMLEPLEARLMLTTSIPSLNEVVQAFDAGGGRLVFAAPLSADHAGAAAVRLDPDGTPDETFGRGGVVRLPDAGDVEDALIDDRGRLLILTFPRAGRPGAVIRLTADGTLDPTFGVNGRARLPYAAYPLWGASVATDPAGRVVVARLVASSSNVYDQAEVIRFTRRGRLDATFGDAGVATLPPDGTDLGGVEIDRITSRGDVALTTWPWFAGGGFVARLTADGTPDPTFGGGDGIAPLPYQPDDAWEDVATLPDGRILRLRHEGQTLLTRFNPDGTPDQTFGDRGTIVLDDSPWTLPTLLADGRLLLEFEDAMTTHSIGARAADR